MPFPVDLLRPILLTATAPAAYVLWLTFSNRDPGLATLWAGGLLAAFVASWTAARLLAPQERYRDFLRRTADQHILAGVLLLGLALQCVLNEGITSDGCLYLSRTCEV